MLSDIAGIHPATMVNRLQLIMATGILAGTLLFSQADYINAQVLNIEQYAIDADTSGIWTGSLSFGFNINNQRTRVVNLRNDANLTYFSERHQYLFLNRINLLGIGTQTSLNDGYFHLRGIFYRHRRINPEGFVQFQYNFDTGLQRRFLTGATMRFNLISEDTFSGTVSTGLMYENEVWLSEDDEQRETHDLIKSTTSVNIREQIAERVDLVLFGYYQARPDQFLEPRITLDSQLKVELYDNIRLAVQWVSTYDSAPILDAPAWTYQLTNNIIISL